MGTKAVKVCAIAFNILFAVLGVLLIVGAALDFDIENLQQSTAIASYVIGALVILFAVLGILAALRESINLAVAVTIFFLALAITHTILVCIDHSSKDPNEGLNTVNRAWGNVKEMDQLQIKHQCCGRASPQDYINLSRQVPASCYLASDNSIDENLFMGGCSAKVQEHHENNVTKMLVIQWILIAFELIGFFLHLYLLINFRNKQRRMQF